VNSFWQDVRYGIRMLAKKPSFTVLAVMTLALGIGASAAIFSIMNGFFLRPMPGRDNRRLAVVAIQRPHNTEPDALSYPDFEDYRAANTVFTEMACYINRIGGFTADHRSESVLVNYVTSNFFETVGVQPAYGRFFLPGEGDKPGTGSIVILGYAYWQRRFGGDLSVIGRGAALNGMPVTIAGIAPKDFPGPYKLVETNLYAPVGLVDRPGEHDPLLTRRAGSEVHALAQPKPGISNAQAQASLELIARRLDEEYPTTNKNTTVKVIPERMARPEPGSASGNVLVTGVFLAMVSLALLVTCVNVANLLLVRAAGRAKEMAIRASLGAGRIRLIRQLLTESLLLSILGGFAGGVLGAGLSHLISSIRVPGDIPIHFDFSFDWRVFACLGAIVAVCAVLVGVAPAWRASRMDLNTTLREGGRSDAGSGGVHNRGRSALVVAQVAGSLVVLIAAGLFLRSLQVASKMDLGFRADSLLNLNFDPSQLGYDEERGTSFFRELKERVIGMPAVEGATFAYSVPMGTNNDSARVWKEGQAPNDRSGPGIGLNRVDEDYFRILGIPILRGRPFTAQDQKNSPRVAIVNEKMAERLWPGENPLGHHFRFGAADAPMVEVVGVARNGKYNWLFEDQQPYFYVPLTQSYSSLRVLQVRTSVLPATLAVPIEGAARDLDPNLPVFGVTTMQESLGGPNGFFLIRMGAMFAASLGGLCLLLAVVGVYGVISYAVSQRTNEIGIRMALGAQSTDVLRLVMRQGLVLVGIGLAAGLALSFGVTRFMRSLLFQIGAADPVTFGAVSLLLIAVALVACYVPARRATRVDPLAAFREE